MALCLDCRSITEKVEERVNQKRITSKDYQRRIHGLATKHYGPAWRDKITFEMVEKSYVSTLYKRYCEKNQLTYNSADPEMELQFWLFWEDLIEGFPDIKPVES
ncbi:MAG: hypothetical protein JEZ00_20820 [Anaerolineaceae bacterium]|nr:hypothetical protein [Anaerolineaceae bacterium]